MLQTSVAKVIRLGWPMCLIAVGFSNVILSDRLTWPIRASELIDSLSRPEILQHKILAVVVLTLGLIELLRRLNLATGKGWLYLFYGLALLTAGVLIGHDLADASHAHFQRLTNSHILMGLMALLALVLKVLADHRLSLGRLAYLYPLTLAALGIQLLLFTESSTK